MFASPFAPSRRIASSYRQLDVETAINAADPHKLITMLFDGALERIAVARSAMQRRDVAAKGEAIGRAIRIISEGLQGSLDLSSGNELGQTLEALYSYMGRRLLQANLDNDEAVLCEVAGLLETLRSGWVAIAPNVPARDQADVLAA